MKSFFKLSLVVVCSAVSISAEESEIRTATITIVTSSADQTASSVLSAAEKLGGRLQSQTNAAIVVLIPGMSPEEAVEKTVPAGAVILARQSTRKDAGERMAQLKAEIESKRKHLANLKRLFDETDFSQTLEIEKEYLKAVQEMEGLLGELKYLTESAQYTTLQVRFQLERAQGTVRNPPQFPWMADRGVEQVLGEFDE
jgi:hypothetical protein